MRFTFSFARWRTGLLAAIGRFPFVLACGAIGSTCQILSIHLASNQPAVDRCQRLAMTVALGMPLFFSLRLISERTTRRARIPLEWLGLPLLALWFFIQPAKPFEPEINFIRWFLLLAALHFFAAISAYLRSAESLGFWQFNRHLFLRFCLATLYSAVLTVGLELALFSASKLFELHLDKAYADLFFVMAGCFHPAFFLAGVPHDFAALESTPDYPRGLKAFTQFALAPLVAVYTAILYAYALKILLARSWPHGWVALPVLLLAGVGIFAALLLHPLGARAEEKWARWYGRNFPRALAPLAILLLLSLRQRIADYGVTEERYLGVVAGFWIFGWALVFIIRARAGIRWIPSSLALVCFLSAFGPWSAGAVSKRSQLHRVTALLQAHGLWADDHARAAPQTIDVPQKESEQLRSSLEYLLRMHGADSVRPVFGTMLGRAKLERWTTANAIIEALHIRARSSADYVNLRRDLKESVPLSGYRQLWQVSLTADGSQQPWSEHQFGDLRLGLDEGVLKYLPPGAATPQAVPLPKRFAEADPGKTELPVAAMTVNFRSGARIYTIIFETVILQPAPNELKISRCSFLLLEK